MQKYYSIAKSRKSSPKSPRKSSPKSPRKSSSKSPRKSSSKSPRKSSSKSPRKSSSKSPRKSSLKSPRKSTSKSPRKSSSKSPRKSSPEIINIFLKFDKTICITIDVNMSLKNFIEILMDKFPILKKIDIYRIYLLNGSKILYFSEVNQNNSLKSFNYFNDKLTYYIMLRPEKEAETENNFMILQKLFSVLRNITSSCRVIVSLFASNTTDIFEKNLIQQFQYQKIRNDNKCIFYVLIDKDFQNTRKHEFYDLINARELKISSNEINDSNLDLSIIKKYKLNKPYINDFNEKYEKYYELFKKEVEPKIKNSNVIHYVLKLNITDEIMNFIKEYDDIFEIYSFSGHKYFE